MRILHLSDFHLRRADGPDEDGIDARASLRRMLVDCAHVEGVELVAVSGDIADDGSPEAYVAAEQMISAYTRERGIPQVWCVGNHDDRPAFAAVLGSGHRGVDGSDVGRVFESPGGERAAQSDVAGWRVVTLDGLVPGKAFGLIGETQLDWLRRVLARPAERGTVLVLHYPPLALGLAIERAFMLQNADALEASIAGSDVRVVLCGHFHHQLVGRLGTVPVVVTPGVQCRIDLTARPEILRAVHGAGATVVDLAGEAAPVSYLLHARDPLAGHTAWELTPEEIADDIARLGPG